MISWIIDKMIEATLGLTLGAMTGWFGGKFSGMIYTRYFEPARFISLKELSQWARLPITMAQNGIIFGAILGILIILAIDARASAKQISQ